jgi:MFS family permease
LAEAPHAMRDRRFAVLWVGSTVSNAGTWMQQLAVPYALFKMTGSSVWVGAGAFVGLVPSVVVTPLVGAAGDRFDRRRVLIVIEVLVSLFAVGLAASWFAGVRSPLLVLIGGSAVSLLGNAGVPCWHAVMAEVVPQESIVSAVSMNSISVNFGKAVGPAVGGAVLAFAGPAWAFVVNAASNMGIVGGLLVLRVASTRDVQAASGIFSNIAAGARHVWGETHLRRALIVSASYASMVLPLQQLIVPLIETEHHRGAGTVGILTGAMGIGSLVAGLLLPRIVRPERVFVLISFLVVASGVEVVLIAIVPSIAVLLVLYLVHGATFTGVMSSLVSTFHFRSDPGFRARSISLYMVSFTVTGGISTLALSVIADWSGIVAPLIGSGFGLVLLGTWQYASLRTLGDTAQPVRRVAS